MRSTTDLLGRFAYEFAEIQPLLPTYLHVLGSALFSIYTGVHASLSRPSSAAKPTKQTFDPESESQDENEFHDQEQKMESLSPMDAIMFPVLAGTTLTLSYFIIKWLDDPALLNKILNWSFSIFGGLSVARLLTDAMNVARSFLFPTKFILDGHLWTVDLKYRKTRSVSNPSIEKDLPLPGYISNWKYSWIVRILIWNLRELPVRKFKATVSIRGIFHKSFSVSVQSLAALVAAIYALGHFNLINKPWWLMNLLGYSACYHGLQIITPNTFWTGTAVLSSLFLYDIYFVFFTPIMITVAKSIDIPAKLVFPRPAAPGEDPSKTSLAMLGLGDIFLPGIMIGLALRFDLYIFYLRKQTIRKLSQASQDKQSAEFPGERMDQSYGIVKAEWRPVIGEWGERFWISWSSIKDYMEHRGVFPKTYFYAGLVGYTIGIIITLGVMHIYNHGQPALLYLVPCVLISVWGTAFIKGDIKEMWEYSELSEEDHEEQKSKSTQSIFSFSRQEKIARRIEKHFEKGHDEQDNDPDSISSSDKGSQQIPSQEKHHQHEQQKNLVVFSISFPKLSYPTRNTKAPLQREEETGSSLISEIQTQDLATEIPKSDDFSQTSGFSQLSAMLNRGEPAGKRQRRT